MTLDGSTQRALVFINISTSVSITCHIYKKKGIIKHKLILYFFIFIKPSQKINEYIAYIGKYELKE